MTACLAAERCDSPTLITKYALARNYSTNDPFITMHGTRRIDSHSQHTPCPPPIEAIPLIQQQPAIRIEYLPVRMTHSEEEKGDGQEATHTHSTTRAVTASENPNTGGGGGGEVEETQARETTHHRPQRQRNRRRPHSTRPINLNCQRREERRRPPRQLPWIKAPLPCLSITSVNSIPM